MPDLPPPGAPPASWKRYVERRLEEEGLTADTDPAVIEELGTLLEDTLAEVLAEGDPTANRTKSVDRRSQSEVEQLVERRFGNFSELARDLGRPRHRAPAHAEPAAPALANPPSPSAPRHWLRSLPNDLRIASRSLRRAPALSITAVVVLALGIGSITTIFSLLNAVVLDPLPYRQPERLGIVTVDAFGGTNFPLVTDSNLIDFSEASGTLDAVESYALMKLLLEAGERTHLVTVTSATPGLLRMLGIRVAHGRDFREQGDVGETGPGNVILSHHLWTSLFAADPGVVGTTVRVSGKEVQVVGILPPDFRLLTRPGLREHSDLLVARRRPTERAILFRRQALVRLTDGQTFESASSELNAIADRGREIDRALNQEGEAHYRVLPLHESLVGNARPALLGVLLAGALLLTLVCACVAHLLLVRGLQRQSDWALRSALGASHARLLSYGLAESVTLATLGGMIGLVVAKLSLGATPLLPGLELPRLDQVALSQKALVFCLVTTTFVAIACGLVPAWVSSRAGARWLRDRRAVATPSSSRVTGILVGGQIAFAVTLLVAAGALFASLDNLTRVPLGFEVDDLVTFDFSLNQDLARDSEARLQFNREFLDWLRSQPDIDSASLVNTLPFAGGQNLASFSTDDATEASFGEKTASFHRILPTYFETLEIPLLEGRDFDTRDTDEAAYVAIVSDQLAKTGWPNESAIGKQLLIEFAAENGTERRPAEIVGVVGDIRETDLSSSQLPQVYLPYWPTSWAQDYVVRTRTRPEQLARRLDDQLRSLGPGIVLDDREPLAAAVRATTARQRLALALIATFASMSLIISSLGLYGVLAATVRQRTPEIGVRIALGASVTKILGTVALQGLRLVAWGATLGLLVALALSSLLSAQWSGLEMTRPQVLLATVGILATAAILACAGPAYRAVRIAPSEALRSE